MPIYEYVCGGCAKGFEFLARSLNDNPPPCPHCGARKAQKQFSTFAPAVAASATGKACNDCSVNASCRSAGRGCPPVCGI